MEDETKIKLGRLACGTALLITHAVTGMDTMLVAVALFLMGIPFELAKKAKEGT